MTTPRARRRALAAVCLGLALLASGCDDAKKPGGDAEAEAEAEAEAPPSPSSPGADDPEGLGLADGQLWRLEIEGEAPLGGEFDGQTVHAKRKADDLSLSFAGASEDVGLKLTLEQVPMGQTGRYTATPASFHATSAGIDCGTAMGGTIKVNLTHNAVDRVAGRIEGDAGCRQPASSKARWSGAFDYSGAIEFK